MDKLEHEYKKVAKLKLTELKKEEGKDYHKISCPNCNNHIAGEGININDKIAKCTPCGVVFSFQKEISNLLTPQKLKQEVFRPEGIDMYYFKDELDFTIQQSYSVGETLWGIFGIVFALFFTVAIFVKPQPFSFGASLFFWLLSAYPIYTWSTHSKNKIYVTINDRFLNIEWRPKKGHKDQSYDIHDIDQLYIKTNPNTAKYDVHVIVNGSEGQKHIRLIPNLDSLSKARYLEQEIERHLGIVDRKVLEENV